MIMSEDITPRKVIRIVNHARVVHYPYGDQNGSQHNGERQIIHFQARGGLLSFSASASELEGTGAFPGAMN